MNLHKQMKMKIDNWLLMALIICLCPACSQTPDLDVTESEFKVLISVNQMLCEEETTRAYGSMTPDRENNIKSLAVFQFDMEGNLRTLITEGNKRYLFKEFTNLGAPNGIDHVATTDMPELSNLKSGKRMHTCLIANIEESMLRSTLFPRGEEDPVNWTEFQKVEFELPFATQTDIESDPTLEFGHLTESYMFGYYDGDVPPSGFTIGLGRILCRLKITFNASGITDDMKFYAAIHNLETHAYFFVAEDSPHHHYPDATPQLLDKSRFDLTTGSGVLQFYSAPHVGDRITAETTTCLYLWCVKGSYEPTMSDTDRAAIIPLGANPKNGQYHLARNTFYSFNVNLNLPQQ